MVEAESREGATLTREHAIVACDELVASIEGAMPAIAAGVRAGLELEDARYVAFIAERRIAAPLVSALRSLSERLRGESAAIAAAGRSGERKKVHYASSSFVERMSHPGVVLEAHLRQGTTLEDADRLPPREGDARSVASAAMLPTSAILAAFEVTLALGGTVSLSSRVPAFSTMLEEALRPLLSRNLLRFAEASAADATIGGGVLPIAITPFLYDRLELDRIVELVVGEHLASSVAGSIRVATSSTWLQRAIFRTRLADRLEALGVKTAPTFVESDADSAAMLEGLFHEDADVIGAVVHPMEFAPLRSRWASLAGETSAFLVALNVAPSVAVDVGAFAVHRGFCGHQLVSAVERVTIEGPLRRTYWSTRSEGAALEFANDASLGAALRLCAGAYLP